MAYFATFLVCHLYLRHRFSSSGYALLDGLWRVVVYAGVLAWAGLVAYSRYASLPAYTCTTCDILIFFVWQVLPWIPQRATDHLGAEYRCFPWCGAVYGVGACSPVLAEFVFGANEGLVVE